MKNVIEKLIAPLKKDAIEKAEEKALEIIQDVKQRLEAAGNDLQICAPYDRNSRNNRTYNLYRSLVTCRQPTHRMGDPVIADINERKCAVFVENSKTIAGLQYDYFIEKLVIKIGPVKSATLTGNHVWNFSILTVEKENGDIEKWKTQMIVNVSKLGTLFNQWPTRKIKRG